MGTGDGCPLLGIVADTLPWRFNTGKYPEVARDGKDRMFALADIERILAITKRFPNFRNLKHQVPLPQKRRRLIRGRANADLVKLNGIVPERASVAEIQPSTRLVNGKATVHSESRSARKMTERSQLAARRARKLLGGHPKSCFRVVHSGLDQYGQHDAAINPSEGYATTKLLEPDPGLTAFSRPHASFRTFPVRVSIQPVLRLALPGRF